MLAVIANRLIEGPSNVKNFICLLLKQFVYKQHCLKKEILFSHFKAYVYQIKNMEKYIAIKNNKLKKYCKEWHDETLTYDDSCSNTDR